MNNDMSVMTIYKIFAEKSELIYRFIALQNEYMEETKKGGAGQQLSPPEVSTLVSIEDNPGITTTELSQVYRKTKAAVSQTIKKLEQKGYVCRERCPVDGKRALLHINDKGKTVTAAFRHNDLNNLKNILDRLLAASSIAEVDAFFKVLGIYTSILDEELHDRKPRDGSNDET